MKPYLCVCGRKSFNPNRDGWLLLTKGTDATRFTRSIFIARVCSDECMATVLLRRLGLKDQRKAAS